MDKRQLLATDAVYIGTNKSISEILTVVDSAKAEFPDADSALFSIEVFGVDNAPSMYLMVNRWETDEEMKQRSYFDEIANARLEKEREASERKELARLLKKYPNGPDA